MSLLLWILLMYPPAHPPPSPKDLTISATGEMCWREIPPIQDYFIYARPKGGTFTQHLSWHACRWASCADGRCCTTPTWTLPEGLCEFNVEAKGALNRYSRTIGRVVEGQR